MKKIFQNIINELSKLWDALFESAPIASSRNKQKMNNDSISDITSGLFGIREDLKRLENKIVSLSQSIEHLDGKILVIKGREGNLSSECSNFRIILNRIEQNELAIIEKLNELSYNTSQTDSLSLSVKNLSNEQYPVILYGGVLCKDNKGFDENILSKEAEGMWFQISINTPTSATYRIVESSLIREQMLSRFDVCISPACDYGEEKPFSMNSIVDVSDGSLVYEKGIWLIKEKVKIEII